MMRAIASYIMKGPMQAVLVAVVCGALSLILFPFSHLSGAVIGLVVLRQGMKQGAIVLVASIVVTAIIAVISLGEPYYAIGFATLVWIPIWLLAGVLRNTISLNKTLLFSILIGWVVIIATYMVLDDPAVWWHDTVINPLFEPVLEQPDVDDEQRMMLQQYLEQAAEKMTGFLAVFIMFFHVFTLIIARWWQSLLYNPGGFRTEFCELKFGKPLALTLAVFAVLTALSMGTFSIMAGQFAMVMFALFALQGLAIAHSVAAKLSASTALLVGVYVVLFLFWQFIALAGLLDNWLDLRNLFNKKSAEEKK